MFYDDQLSAVMQSLPMRERGLKSQGEDARSEAGHVAPHAGAWIEIHGPTSCPHTPVSRSPCGSVD